MSGWSYQPMEEDGFITVREIYFNDEREIHAFSEPISPGGENIDELIHDLELMLGDVKRAKERNSLLNAKEIVTIGFEEELKRESF